MSSPKYNRTPHLPSSPGGTSDDRRLASVDHLLRVELVITEKMDGSNVCLERGACFARSHSSTASHPSFDAFKAAHATIRGRIDPGVQVFGEWLYAEHSIHYDALPNYFMAFGVRDTYPYHGRSMTWDSWDEVCLWANELSVPTVPVLWRGKVTTARELDKLVAEFTSQPSVCGGAREGLVIRTAYGFDDADFGLNLAKWVRKNHVQTKDHWKTQKIVKNGLLR